MYLRRLTDAVRLCFYAFMRTTVELPPALLRKAKMRAAARGESLKSLLTRAVATELGQSGENTARRRVEFPLFGDPAGPPVDLSGLDLASALAADDVVDAALAGRQRRGSRGSRGPRGR